MKNYEIKIGGYLKFCGITEITNEEVSIIKKIEEIDSKGESMDYDDIIEYHQLLKSIDNSKSRVLEIVYNYYEENFETYAQKFDPVWIEFIEKYGVEFDPNEIEL